MTPSSGFPGIEAINAVQTPAAGRNGFGEEGNLRGIGRLDQQILLPHPEKGVAAAVADEPLERPDVEDPGEALFIELGHLLLPDEEVVTTHLFLHAGDLLDQRLVVDKEGEGALDLPSTRALRIKIREASTGSIRP